MRWEDLDVALEFFKSTDEGGGIVVQVPYMRDIPEVRRHIIQVLGVPSFSHSQSLKYGSRYINIESVLRMDYHSRVCSQDQLFYVGWISEAEFKDFDKFGIYCNW